MQMRAPHSSSSLLASQSLCLMITAATFAQTAGRRCPEYKPIEDTTEGRESPTVSCGGDSTTCSYKNWRVRPGVEPFEINEKYIQDGICCEDDADDSFCEDGSCKAKCYCVAEYKSGRKLSNKGQISRNSGTCSGETSSNEFGTGMKHLGTDRDWHFKLCANNYEYNAETDVCEKCPEGSYAPFARQYAEDFLFRHFFYGNTGTDKQIAAEYDLRKKCLTFKENSLDAIWGLQPSEETHESKKNPYQNITVEDKLIKWNKMKQSVHQTTFACGPGEKWVLPKPGSETFNMATQYTAVTCVPCDGMF